MYKFSHHITNSNLILVRKRICDGSCSALVVFRQPIKKYSTDDLPKPCPPPRKRWIGEKLKWGFIGATLITGTAVIYAKNSPETRNWLAANLPFADHFIAVVYQEDSSYGDVFSKKVKQASTMISEFVFGRPGITPPVHKPMDLETLEKEATKAFAPKTYELPDQPFRPLYKEEIVIDTPKVTHPATLIKTDKCDPQEPFVVDIKKDIVDVETEMHMNTKIAIEKFKEVKKLCEKYNAALFKVIETDVSEFDRTMFSNLESAQKERDQALAIARTSIVKARVAIDTIEKMICDGVKAPPGTITTTQRHINTFRDDLCHAENDCNEALAKSILHDKYWDKIENARCEFRKELQTLFPGINLEAKKLDLDGEVDLLLLYTIKKIQFYQKELAEIQTVRELQLTRAIECRDDKALIEAKVDDMIARDKLEKEKEYMTKSLQIEADAQRKLKEELRKQCQLLQDVSTNRLKQKDAELQAQFDRALSEAVEKERVAYKTELAMIVGKMKAIEATLSERARAEEQARRSGSLWAAGEALLQATKKKQEIACLHNELTALEKAGKDDKLVESVLKGLPSDVREQGIVTEGYLRRRFDKMEQSAKKVALVGNEGASLVVYFLSWLQSKMIFSKCGEIPKDELDNLPTDFSKLDTFDIMQRARYHMDHNNLTVALKYVNLLQGASRKAASSWAEAARRHLEVQQAAQAVMAHASANAMCK